MRRALHIFSVALITAGIVILIDVAMTLLWEEPISTVYASIQQSRAGDSLDDLERSFFARDDVEPLQRDQRDSSGQLSAAQRKQLDELARIFSEEADTGEGIGRLEVPSVGIESVIVEGTDTATLQQGPGRYPETAFPGEGRTIGVAGHRTTYGAPFRKINEIADGDEIVVEMPYATFTYVVQKHEIVDPNQVEIVDDVGYERLVLTACHPLYSAAQRWAVFARLAETSLTTAEAAGSVTGPALTPRDRSTRVRATLAPGPEAQRTLPQSRG